MVECPDETLTSIPIKARVVAIFAGARLSRWKPYCSRPLVHLQYIHLPLLTYLTCNPTLSPRSISLGVDAGIQCRRSSAPPHPAKRRRLRLLLVVVLLPHQHPRRLRNLRQNQPTSRRMSRQLPLPHLNPHPSRAHPQSLRNQHLHLHNSRPCDGRSRDNMCDLQIL
jgi:hypothetical protein